MALSPSVATELTAFDETVVRDMEVAIDDKIQRDWTGTQAVVYNFGNSRPTRKQAVELVKRYRAAGWKKVDIGDNAGDTYIKLSN